MGFNNNAGGGIKTSEFYGGQQRGTGNMGQYIKATNMVG